MEPAIIILLGGILPFGSIFIEVLVNSRVLLFHLMPIIFCRYFVFTSFWAYKIYYVFGFMLLVFIILSIVTICATIVCTYFLLNAEDYRWCVTKSQKWYWKFLMNAVFVVLIGNGQVCVQLVQLEYMCTSTRFITSFLKQSMPYDWAITHKFYVCILSKLKSKFYQSSESSTIIMLLFFNILYSSCTYVQLYR